MADNTQIPFAPAPIDTKMLDSSIRSLAVPVAPAQKTPTVASSSSNQQTTAPTTAAPAPAPQYNVMTGELLKPGEQQPIYNGITGQKIGTNTYDPNQITNPNSASSSSTVVTNNNIATSTTKATDSANGVKPALSDLQNRIMSTYGYSEDAVRGMNQDKQDIFAMNLRAEDVAQKQADQSKSDQDKMNSASLAEQNAEYASAVSDLNAQKEKDLNTAKTTTAQLNPYGGANTDSDNYSGAINTAYDKLNTQLMNSAQQAKAALDSGNFQAYAKINADMAQAKETGIANIQSMLADLNKTQTQNNQFEQTITANTQAKATTAFQSMLTSPSISSTAGKSLSALPDNWADMTPAQQAQAKEIAGGYLSAAEKTGTYVDANGKFDPGQAWTAVKGGLTNSIKQQSANTAANNSAIAANRAQAYMMTAQANLADKQAGAIDAQTVGTVANGAYLNALQAIAPDLTKAQNTTNLSSLSYFISNNDVNGAKTAITNSILKTTAPTDQSTYTGISTLARALAGIKTKINALTKDQQTGFINGNVNTIAAKFGQSTDPQLRALGQELTHLSVFYAKAITGVRGAASAASGNSAFTNLVPNIKDTKSLAFSDIDAFVNTANDIMNGAVSTKIGQNNFDAIYGSGGVLGNTTGNPTANTTVMTGPDGKSYNVPNDQVSAFKAAGGK